LRENCRKFTTIYTGCRKLGRKVLKILAITKEEREISAGASCHEFSLSLHINGG
jgi:hypothetical protein